MKKAVYIFKSFRVKITVFMILAMVFAGAISNFLIYRYALDSQFEQLRDKLITIAQTTALTISPDEIRAIPLEKQGIDSLQYKTVARKLAVIRRVVPSIKYLYILTKTRKPGILKFMADAEAGVSDNGPVTYPGDEYDAKKFPEMLKGFSRATADRELGRDQWGVFLSGYAPIFDKSGESIAILGVDMKAQDVRNVQRQVQVRAAFVLLLGTVIAILLGIVMSGGMTRQINELSKGAERIAEGDLDYRVKIKGGDEIARLGHLFNKMSINLKHHIEELRRTTAEKERLTREIEIARGIQQSFLPDAFPQIPGLEVVAISLPARVVGGDFYDFIPLLNNKWGLVVADVSGKGVPAALFMALSRTLMRSTAAGAVSPSDAINHANRLILQDSKASMFVTLFYAVVDTKTMTLDYANAGHNPPLLVTGLTNNSNILLLKAQGVPLGISSDVATITERIILKSGDMVLLYTDGVTEAINKEGEQFEMERLEKIARDNRHASAQEIMDKVQDELKTFVGRQPQYDDITIMVLKAI